MPKFAIAKYRNFRAFDNEVGLPKDRIIIFAIPYSCIPKKPSEENFEFGSFTLVCSHTLMALLFCQAIHFFLF